MVEQGCIKEKCQFYDDYCEAAYDGCLFGASEQDKESEKGCYVEKRRKESKHERGQIGF